MLTAPAPPINRTQVTVLVTLFLLVADFFTLTVLDVDVNLGVVALTLAVFQSLLVPDVGRRAVSKVDWGTILLLGGILTYVGALIPLAVPLLVAGGGLEMTGFIYALAISASLVDCAPFSATGATIVASAAEPERPLLSKRLTAWGFAMVLIGPAFTILTMVLPRLLLA